MFWKRNFHAGLKTGLRWLTDKRGFSRFATFEHKATRVLQEIARIGGVGLRPTRSSPNFGPSGNNSPIWFMPPGIDSTAADRCLRPEKWEPSQPVQSRFVGPCVVGWDAGEWHPARGI